MPERRTNVPLSAGGGATSNGIGTSSLMVASSGGGGGSAMLGGSNHSGGFGAVRIDAGSGGGGGSNNSNMNSRPSMSKSKSNYSKSKAKAKAQFNPKLIFSQIVAMQCFHYVILGFIIQVNHVLFNTSITVDRIFVADEYLNLWSLHGWIDNFAILLTSCIGSVLMAIIVEKSKKVLDFGITLFLIHLFLCILYNHGKFPASWDWWIIHILSTILMILLGEYLCSKKELDDIPLLTL